MKRLARSIHADVTINKRHATVNGVKAIDVTVRAIDGVKVRPTRLFLTGAARKRGNKLYAPNGVYTIVGG